MAIPSAALLPVVFLFSILCVCSNLLVVVYGQTTDFQGPGYVTCPNEEYELQACETIDADTTLCTDDAIQACNFTTVSPTLDNSRTTIIIPLVCECIVALGCPGSCSFSMGDLPTDNNSSTPPSTVANTANFTGVGSITCPYADYFRARCIPTVRDNDLTLCGTCDPTILDQNFGYEQGDESITVPLVCNCSVTMNCPDSCNFTAGIATLAPTPADSTPELTPVSTMPVVSFGPTVNTITAPSSAVVPTTAVAPVRPTNTTSSVNHDCGSLYSILLMVAMTSISSLFLL